MYKYGNHAGQSATASALVARARGLRTVDGLLGIQPGQVTLIGPGTFLVASYLGRRLGGNSLQGPENIDSYS